MENKEKLFFDAIQEFIETVINPQMKTFAEKSIEKFGKETVNRFMIQTDVYELVPMDQVTTEELQGDKKVN